MIAPVIVSIEAATEQEETAPFEAVATSAETVFPSTFSFKWLIVKISDKISKALL